MTKSSTPQWLTSLKAKRDEADRLARLAASREWAMQSAGFMRDAVTGAWVSVYVTR